MNTTPTEVGRDQPPRGPVWAFHAGLWTGWSGGYLPEPWALVAFVCIVTAAVLELYYSQLT
jgi:hypothetical protein